ncbi:MAG: TolC family protein [Gemmatimonadaceae bacterium]
MTLRMLAALSLIAASTATGQPGQDTTNSVRLGRLYEQLARSSPRVDAAAALARAAQARVSSASTLPDPQLQLGFMNRSLPSLAPMGVLGMTQLQLMQMIPTAGKLSLAGRVASAQASAARARVDDVRWEQRARVAMAFYEYYEADRAVGIALNTKRLLQDVATTARTMYTVGDGRQADVLRAQVEIARMTADVVRMGTMRVTMSARLVAALNTPLSATISARPELPALPDILPPLDSLVLMAESYRPMIAAGKEDLRAAEASARLAAKEIWPDLQVGVQYAQQRGLMGTDHMGSLMIGATLPIFARRRQLQMREEGLAMQAMAQSDLAAMRADTRGRVLELYADFTRARDLRVLYRTTVLPQAQASVTSSLAAYRVGDVNFMTLLDNQMTVNRYRQELFTLEAEQGKAVAELEMLIGRALFDANTVASGASGDRH